MGIPPELLADSHYLPQLGPDWPQRLQRVLGYGTDYFMLETNGTQGELWRALAPSIPDPPYRDETRVILRADQVARLKQLGVALSVQNHLYLAAPSLKRYLGIERASHASAPRPAAAPVAKQACSR